MKKLLTFSLAAWMIGITLSPLAAAPTRQEVREVQSALVQEGYNPGPVDGIWGRRTRAALLRYQRDNGLTATGRIDQPTLVSLGLDEPLQPALDPDTDVLVPSGTVIAVRLNDRLDSETAQPGDRFTMTVDEPLRVSNRLVIPKGTIVQGTVVDAEKAERPRKAGKLVLRPDNLKMNGRTIPLQGEITAEGDKIKGEGATDDLEELAIGAGIGAALGGLLKGGKGALAGLIIGGAGTFLATKGGDVELEQETMLEVRLTSPMTIETRY